MIYLSNLYDEEFALHQYKDSDLFLIAFILSKLEVLPSSLNLQKQRSMFVDEKFLFQISLCACFQLLKNGQMFFSLNSNKKFSGYRSENC